MHLDSGEPAALQSFLCQANSNQSNSNDSLLVATKADRSRESAGRQDRWLSQFVIAFGTDEGDSSTTFNGTIPQILMLFNGDLDSVSYVTSYQDRFLDQIDDGKSNKSRKDKCPLRGSSCKVAVVKRTAICKSAMLLARKGQVKEALQDVWWALLNSNEFILNH